MEKDFNLTDNDANVLSPSGRELERGKFCHIHMNSPKRKLDGVKSTFCSFLSLCCLGLCACSQKRGSARRDELALLRSCANPLGCKEKEMNQRKRNTVLLRASSACRDGRYRSVSMLTIASHVRNICEHCLSVASLRARCHAKRGGNAVADCRKRQRVFFSFVYFFSFASRQKKRNRHMQPAFTLAEVLIVLGIIGLIADMTIPTLINNVNDKVTVTKLQKAYSVLSQATRFAEIDEGALTEWVIQDTSVEGITNLFNLYKPHLNILRECQNKGGCGFETTLGTDTYAFTLNDGTNISMDVHAAGSEDMKNAFGVATGKLPQALVFWVDVNGDKKPNKTGEDIFAFVTTDRGLGLAGQDNDSIKCTKTGSKWDCAAKVLREGVVKF